MSAAFNLQTKTRGIWRRSWRPGVELLESEIISMWFDLCSEVKTHGPDTGYAHVKVRQLHDLGVFRYRALRRQGAIA